MADTPIGTYYQGPFIRSPQSLLMKATLGSKVSASEHLNGYRVPQGSTPWLPGYYVLSVTLHLPAQTGGVGLSEDGTMTVNRIFAENWKGKKEKENAEPQRW